MSEFGLPCEISFRFNCCKSKSLCKAETSSLVRKNQNLKNFPFVKLKIEASHLILWYCCIGVKKDINFSVIKICITVKHESRYCRPYMKVLKYIISSEKNIWDNKNQKNLGCLYDISPFQLCISTRLTIPLKSWQLSNPHHIPSCTFSFVDDGFVCHYEFLPLIGRLSL